MLWDILLSCLIVGGVVLVVQIAGRLGLTVRGCG